LIDQRIVKINEDRIKKNRKFACNWSSCFRSYDSKKCLSQHVRIKHLNVIQEKSQIGNESEETESMEITELVEETLLDERIADEDIDENKKLHACKYIDCELSYDSIRCLRQHERLKHSILISEQKKKKMQKQIEDFVRKSQGNAQIEEDKSIDNEDEELVDEGRASEKNVISYSSMHKKMKNFACKWKYCCKSYDSKRCLRQHVRIIHLRTNEKKQIENKEQFLCVECNRFYKTESSLQSHKDFIHRNIKRNKCSWPGCESAFRGELKIESCF